MAVLARVIAYPGESIESLLKRFRKLVCEENILEEIRSRQFHLSKSDKMRLKIAKRNAPRRMFIHRSKQKQPSETL